MRFRVTAIHNPTYAGQTLGVQFNDGTAVVDGPDDKQTRYGVAYKDLPEKFKDLGGYAVEVMEDRPAFPEKPPVRPGLTTVEAPEPAQSRPPTPRR